MARALLKKISIPLRRNEMQAEQQAGFDQMAVGLKSAITDFQDAQSPEALAGIIAAFKPVGDIAYRLFRKTSRYVRRHPVETTVAVLAIGFIVATLVKPASAPQINSDRNY
jgi:hypothetical protein